MKGTFATVIISILLIGLIAPLIGNTAKADPIMVYIRADGSIDPASAPITTSDSTTYTLTDNFNGSIIVQKDNIVFDGSNHVVNGFNVIEDLYNEYGIVLSNVTGVTIKNTMLMNSYDAIYLNQSSNSQIINNTIYDVGYGIRLYGMDEYQPYNNTISANNITACYQGIILYNTINNTIVANTLQRNTYGLYINEAYNNTIYHNDFVNSQIQAYCLSDEENSLSLIHI